MTQIYKEEEDSQKIRVYNFLDTILTNSVNVEISLSEAVSHLKKLNVSPDEYYSIIKIYCKDRGIKLIIGGEVDGE